MTDTATDPLADDLARATDLLRSATDVTLLGHVRPDADALGSALALALALRARGATVRVSFGEHAEVPESLRWLDSAGLLVPMAGLPAAEPLLVTLDSASLQRLGELRERPAATVAAGGAVLTVDHHSSNTRFGTLNVVDETAEATAVLVVALIDGLGVPLDEPIARCLYAGLVTDTSGFRRATPATHAIAGRLLEAGADPDVIVRRVVEDHPYAWLPMLAAVLGGARFDAAAAGGLGLVHAAIPHHLVTEVRAEETESVIDVVRTTREAEVAAVLKELTPGSWTVSLRSATRFDVAAAAKALGGGGHVRAAGCTIAGTEAEALAAVRGALG